MTQKFRGYRGQLHCRNSSQEVAALQCGRRSILQRGGRENFTAVLARTTGQNHVPVKWQQCALLQGLFLGHDKECGVHGSQQLYRQYRSEVTGCTSDNTTRGRSNSTQQKGKESGETSLYNVTDCMNLSFVLANTMQVNVNASFCVGLQQQKQTNKQKQPNEGNIMFCVLRQKVKGVLLRRQIFNLISRQTEVFD